MPGEFPYDGFLSHSAKDKPVVRDVAARLKKDGLRVWFDEWEIRPGDNIPHKIEEGLERSRVLVLCMSANAFGSDWAQLESGTFRFRNPLNKADQARRFLPLRFDDAPITGSLAQFHYINWLPAAREQEYAKLLEACRPQAKGAPAIAEHFAEQAIQCGASLELEKLIAQADGLKQEFHFPPPPPAWAFRMRYESWEKTVMKALKKNATPEDERLFLTPDDEPGIPIDAKMDEATIGMRKRLFSQVHHLRKIEINMRQRASKR